MASVRSGAYSTAGLTAATPEGHVRVHEGHAVVMMPPAKEGVNDAAVAAQVAQGDDTGEAPAIFYNKAQVVNRDLSVCVIEAFAKLREREPLRKGGTGDAGIVVLEALSATGLRALRYWHEVEGLRHVIANDLDPEAVDCIRTNCELNEVPTVSVAEFNACGWRGAPTSDREARVKALNEQRARVAATPRGIVPTCDDAINLMHTLGLDPERNAGTTLLVQRAGPDGVPTVAEVPQKQMVDVVDLDPYGTASPFLDSAMKCAKEGALMLITCTDSAILCGNYAETCHAKYGSVSARLGSCHEMAARIVLAAAERTANRHAKFIEPLISLHIDFYVRVVIRVRTQPAEVKLSVSKLAHVFHCVECPAFHLKPVGRVRPAKGVRNDALPAGGDGGLTNRKALRTERRAAAANVGAKDLMNGGSAAGAAALDVEPVEYPETLPRSVPMHCTSNPIEDVPRRCVVCGGRVAIAGPIYAAPSQSPEFIDQVLEVVDRKGEAKLKAIARVRGLLLAAKGELPRAPLFYKVPDLASMMKIQVPPNPIIIGALCRLGYECSQVHCEPSGLKTTAPPQVIASVLATYRAKVLLPRSEEPDGAPVSALPERIVATVLDDLDLSYDKQYDSSSKATGVAKFIQNPAFWGPRARHCGTNAAATSK